MSKEIARDNTNTIRIVRVDHSNIVDTIRMLRSCTVIKQEQLMLVKSILDDVKARGDDALLEYTGRFDGITLSRDMLRVSEHEIKDAYTKVSDKEVKVLKEMKRRIERVERSLLKSIKGLRYSIYDNGIRVTRVIRPIDSVGCYVPGGKARYPSTMLMCALPAKIAGVKRVIACTPPKHGDATIDPLTLVASDIAGVDEVYRVGGAQAIAAMAYGTESIKSVSKIVGPGGMVVNIAKLLVSSSVAIDMFAGPTELIVIADDTADPRLIALDIISQAEHSSDTLCGLVTCSEHIAYATARELSALLNNVSRSDIIKTSMQSNGFIALCNNMDVAIQLINEFAPEHLQIIARDAKRIAMRISNAGMILIGRYSPSAASDYCIGTNHVLPTSGIAKARASLTCLDFIKVISMAELSKEGLKKVAGHIGYIATAEGLDNHYKAVTARLDNINK